MDPERPIVLEGGLGAAVEEDAVAGLVIGIAFLDLIPEVTEAAFHEAIPIRALMVTVLIGFLAIFLLEKLTIIHGEKQHDVEHG